MTHSERVFETWVAASSLAWTGGEELVRGIGWAGCRFDAVITPDLREVARRAEAGIGAVPDYQLVTALSSLPEGERVPWSMVEPVLTAYLQGLPTGFVDCDHTGVLRLLRQPVDVLLLLKTIPGWRSSGQVGLLARVAPAVAVLRHRPRRLEQAMAAAKRAGIGLVHMAGSEVVPLVLPSNRVRLGPSRQRLVEVVYRAWLRQTATMPAAPSHAFS